MVWLGARSERVFPLVIFQEGTVDHERYTQERYVRLLSSETTCSATTGRFNKMEEGCIFTKNLKIGVGFICHLSMTKNIGLQTVLISIFWIVIFGMSLQGLSVVIRGHLNRPLVKNSNLV